MDSQTISGEKFDPLYVELMASFGNGTMKSRRPMRLRRRLLQSPSVFSMQDCLLARVPFGGNRCDAGGYEGMDLV